MPPNRFPRWLSRLSDMVYSWLGVPDMTARLTAANDSFRAYPYEIGGRRYLLDIGPRQEHAPGICLAGGRGTLSYGGTDSEVTFAEVTDPGLKYQVLITSARDKVRPVLPLLVMMGSARDETPEGLLPAVPHVTVLEVIPAA